MLKWNVAELIIVQSPPLLALGELPDIFNGFPPREKVPSKHKCDQIALKVGL